MEIRNFLNIADGALLANLELPDFHRSLIFNILFKERILLHGGYYFNSRLIGEHVKAHKDNLNKSLLAYFSKKGIVTPTIYDSSIQDMEQLHKVLSSPKVYGNIESTFPQTIPEHLTKFLKIVSKGFEVKKPLYFNEENPNGVVKDFHTRIMSFYNKNEPFISKNPKKGEMGWEKEVFLESKELFSKCFESALFNSNQKGIKRLQRSELYAAIGRYIMKEEAKSNNEALVSAMMTYLKNDKKRQRALRTTIGVINTQHHIDISSMYNASIDFPTFNQSSKLVLDEYRLAKELTSNKIRPFEFDIYLPPLKSIIEMEPKELYNTRKTYLKTYLDSLESYSLDNSSIKEKAVKDVLKEYCNEIISKSGENVYYKAAVKIKPKLKRAIIITAAATDYLKHSVPIFTFLSASGALDVVIDLSIDKFIKPIQIIEPHILEVSAFEKDL